MVNLQGAVVDRTKDSDHRDPPGSHLAEALQILIPLLHIHAVLSLGSGDQLEAWEDKQPLVHSAQVTRRPSPETTESIGH